MKTIRATTATLAALLTLISTLAFAQPAPSSCANYAINATVNSPGATNGHVAIVLPGDVFTFTVTPLTATTASWRIVSDGSGSPTSTLTPGGTSSGSLTYTVTAASSYFPIGYYFDSITGAVQISGTCASGAFGVPATSPWANVMLALLLAAMAGWSTWQWRRRH